MPRKPKNLRLGGVSSAHAIDPNAAGIDIGATEIYIAVPVDRDPHPVRRFSTFTEDLLAAADWLEHCRVATVAMESTGVYWIPLFQILEARGLTVCLVNARHVKNVPGRKSDVCDCQCNIYIQRDYCAPASAPSSRSAPSARWCVIATAWCSYRRCTYSICKRRSIR